MTWKLCTGMAASDVQDTLDQALEETRLYQAHVVHRPRLLSDNGPCYISGDLVLLSIWKTRA
jgi:putative transposase